MIRIRVPLVRPLVRCTFKRLLRVLPSILLLLFVFSLIFVTLMQIAVIHSHRRGHFVPGRHDPLSNSTLLPPTGHTILGVPSLQLPNSVTRPVPHKRPETLRVEAFLDKSAPTLEANAVIVKNMIHCTRVRRVLDFLGARTSSREKVHVVEKLSFKDDTVFGMKKPCCSDYVKWHKRKTCPSVPPLAGRLRVDVSFHNRTDVEDLLRRSPYMRGRGSWTPHHCAPLFRVAIIIPYRDRLEHLTTLLYTLHPLLQRQLLEYRVYVVEQWGNDTFNKGVLMNAGVREALKDSDFQCFVFHDVDMIPEDDRNLYTCPPSPRHLSVAVDKFNYTLPYALLVGGVFSIKLEHYLAVNGYSNLYWGWGGEDDDMAYRIRFRKLDIIRPPEALARYSMIKHEHRPESPNAIRSALLRMAKKRSSRDGLNTVKYRVLWRHEHLSYSHLMIDIGKHHRWQFLNGQRLVINF
ncbi:beta-1,4-N-acetylgalactosaminyltransferase bre-4 isoform X1 [Parasteatoda tepidariorum]|uniref:beta-1,4-N-acetylgalactosaminyltransferase bre-4 isoform X1 n=1 Tax=Parasteatoda tepidariorum TaxID=114398 RepID=UPI00077FD8B4|nr:beta-1,4-N-acetylgalactosaminyltransferase bre-4 isoform X1 [Parasteatoda tepidariorum]